MKKSSWILLWAAFILYCLVMLWLLFGQRIGWITSGTYLEQLRTVMEFISLFGTAEDSDLLRHAIVNLLGNVGVFVPLGFFLPCLWPKLRHFGRHALCAVLIILVVELIQLFSLLGSFDIDDLLLNLLGTSTGHLLFRIILLFFAKTKQKRSRGIRTAAGKST